MHLIPYNVLLLFLNLETPQIADLIDDTLSPLGNFGKSKMAGKMAIIEQNSYKFLLYSGHFGSHLGFFKFPKRYKLSSIRSVIWGVSGFQNNNKTLYGIKCKVSLSFCRTTLHSEEGTESLHIKMEASHPKKDDPLVTFSIYLLDFV